MQDQSEKKISEFSVLSDVPPDHMEFSAPSDRMEFSSPADQMEEGFSFISV